MFKEGDYVVYKREVCKIKEIKEKYFKSGDYYVLSLVNDNSLKIQVPVSNKGIRKVISKEEAQNFIDKINSIDIIKCDDKLLELKYKECMKTEKLEDLIKIIKTTYLRNKERTDNHKKTGDKDNHYFEVSEKYLYTELSIALGKTFEETKEYIINKLSNQKKKS